LIKLPAWYEIGAIEYRGMPAVNWPTVNWIATLFGRKAGLTAEQALRLESWRDSRRADTGAGLDRSRFVVVDVDTSGLSLSRDRLFAFCAVAVVDGMVDLDDSFEVVLQQTVASSRENILIHGIGGGAQAAGQSPAEALLAFLEYLRKDPLVAFHVTFDETMLRRAIRQFLGFDLRHDWLDLAYAVPGLYPEQAGRFRTLDDWLTHFAIRNYARHNALADAVSTAQLFMVAISQARRQNISSYQGLRRVEKAQRWVNRES
jgi:DNA polymerase-3 subunit epsilon